MFNPDRINVLIEERKRVDKKFTKLELTNYMHITPVSLNNIIDRKSIPGIDKILSIALFFNVDMNYFFDDFDRKSAIPINGPSPRKTPDNEPKEPETESESLYKELYLLQKEMTEILKRENEHLRGYTQSNIVREKSASVG